MGRLRGAALALLAAAWLAACQSAPPDPAAAVIAPTGMLRAGLYSGTPTSILPGEAGAPARGVGYELGLGLARALGLPYRPVVFATNAEVLSALKTGAVDVAFTNASPERARQFVFSSVYLDIELGYLAGPDNRIASATEVDRPGVRVGVTERSTSDGVLSARFKQAQVVRARTVEEGIALLAAGRIDLYATNKATLFEMAEQIPGATVLPGNWGLERHAVALPKSAAPALPSVEAYVRKVKADGELQASITRAGLRGAAVAE